MKSIQTKLTVIILIIFFIALSTMGGLNFFKAREIVTDNLAREMGNEASNAADDVGVWLEGRIAQLTMLAATPTMARGTLAEIVPFMEAARKSWDVILTDQPEATAFKERFEAFMAN